MSSLFDDQVPLLRPWLGDEEVAAVAEVIRGGWISQGPKVEEFETRIAEWVGVEHAVAVNAATSALHLSLEVSGVKPGDKVICPAFTCMATANAIEMAGARGEVTLPPVKSRVSTPRVSRMRRCSAEPARLSRAITFLIDSRISSTEASPACTINYPCCAATASLSLT